MGLFSRSDKNTTTAPVIDKANASPNPEGFFGEYGGAFLPPPLVPVMEEIAAKYEELKKDKSFWDELHMAGLLHSWHKVRTNGSVFFLVGALESLRYVVLKVDST